MDEEELKSKVILIEATDDRVNMSFSNMSKHLALLTLQQAIFNLQSQIQQESTITHMNPGDMRKIMSQIKGRN